MFGKGIQKKDLDKAGAIDDISVILVVFNAKQDKSLLNN